MSSDEFQGMKLWSHKFRALSNDPINKTSFRKLNTKIDHHFLTVIQAENKMTTTSLLHLKRNQPPNQIENLILLPSVKKLLKYSVCVCVFIYLLIYLGFPGGLDNKEPSCNAETQVLSFPVVGKIPWRWEWLPTPVFLPGGFQGQRIWAGYSPQGCKQSDTTEWLTHTLTHTRIYIYITACCSVTESVCVFSFIYFSITGYYKILSIVLSDIQ